MVVHKGVNAIVCLEELLLSLRRNANHLPASIREAIDELATRCRGRGQTVDLASVMRDLAAPARRVSGFHPAGYVERGADDPAPAAQAADVPDVVKVVTPCRDFAFFFADYEAERWRRLAGRIESMLIDELLRADGRPVSGRDLEALRGCARSWTKVVWVVNDAAPESESPFIESHGDPARPRGRRRPPTGSDELPDGRSYYIRPNLWRISPPVHAESLRGAEALLVEMFGRPIGRRARR